jgi:hypothetical protein
MYDGQEVSLGTTLKDSLNNWIEFNTLRFYLSELYITDNQGQELAGDQYQLIDLENPESLTILKHENGIIQLRFILGIDSLTNVSGILDGPLDPINGMYWTWNSGYINFKLEGRSNLSLAPKNEFEYHLGGYLSPYSTAREIILQPDPKKQETIIEIQLDKWLRTIDMSETNSVMIPGPKAVQLSDELVNVFMVRKNDE